jgi:signal transduction histidine kinase
MRNQDKKELYVFCLGFDGVMLAHPANKDLVGKDQRGYQCGKTGKKFVLEFIEKAQSQDGLSIGGSDMVKLNQHSYIRKVPGKDAFVGCGYYVK